MVKRERSDATRNREALLRAARALFADRGPDVPLAEIADAAGVSRTTLHRHFTSREDLAATVYQDSVDLIEARAAALGGRPTAAIELLNEVFDMQLRNRGVGSVLGEEGELLQTLGKRTAAAFEPLVRTGCRAGVLHPDVTPADFMLALQLAEAGLQSPEPFERTRTLLMRALVADTAIDGH